MTTGWARPLSVAVAGVVLTACGPAADVADPNASSAASETASVESPSADEQRFPTILDVSLSPGSSADGWDVAVTISSPYDSPDRYADAFRVAAPDGSVLGLRELTHDHANEQPFTRSLLDVEIPTALDQVVVTARDSVHGWADEGTEAQMPLR